MPSSPLLLHRIIRASINRMDTQFAFLSFSKNELIELHRALLARFIMEDSLRKEHALEPIDPSPLLTRVEQLLQIPDRTSHAIFEQVDEEVWQHSWFAFTDEWAWFRARQDVRKKLGSELANTSPKDLEALIDHRYDEWFDRYVHELDMNDKPTTERKKKPSRQIRNSSS
ncbi:MAG: hypothetical protein WCV84_02110 [Patescibacteria group bacterium]